MDTQEDVVIQLKREEAIVLFEFVSRFTESGTLTIEDQSEARILWNVCCDLEKALPESFLTDWLALLKQAQLAVRDEEE